MVFSVLLLKEYEFRVFDIGCGGTKEEVSISRSGAWLIIDGAVNIPDPCYTIKMFPEADKDGNRLNIHVKASKVKVFCIQCLARAKFTIRVNVFYLKQTFQTNKIKLFIDYYVRGRTSILYDGDLEL
mgnify:CR=1 FL=1